MFEAYEHMINNYGVKKVNTSVLWVATEKIHGTNLSFICTETNDILSCRRNAILGEKESFMNYQNILNKYKDDIIGINREIKKEYEDLKQIQIYGELFGGNYPGIVLKGSTKIQKGVNYMPGNDFMVFDIKIILNSGKIFYYDFEKLINLLIPFSLKLVPIIKIDLIDELLKMNPVFESVVYSYYGLPKIENNYAEGYVIKLMKESDNVNEHQHRSIFKFKNPSFNEIKSEKSPNTGVKNKYISIIINYVSENRFNNVKTKLSDDYEKEELYDALYEDLMVDFLDDNPEIIEEELNECKKIVKNVVKNRVNKWINM
jgi:Rnl2 family RNA ligase